MKPKEERDKEDAKKVPKDETSLAEKTKSGKQGNKNKGQTTPDSPQTSKEVPVCYSVMCVLKMQPLSQVVFCPSFVEEEAKVSSERACKPTLCGRPRRCKFEIAGPMGVTMVLFP